MTQQRTSQTWPTVFWSSPALIENKLKNYYREHWWSFDNSSTISSLWMLGVCDASTNFKTINSGRIDSWPSKIYLEGLPDPEVLSSSNSPAPCTSSCKNTNSKGTPLKSPIFVPSGCLSSRFYLCHKCLERGTRASGFIKIKTAKEINTSETLTMDEFCHFLENTFRWALDIQLKIDAQPEWRVSMGLTVRRKTVKNLAVRR